MKEASEEDASPLWALFALTPSADWHTSCHFSWYSPQGLLSLRQKRTRTLPSTLEAKAQHQGAFVFLLPSESSVVSPPLYSWGAPTKTPLTFCHVGNKSASFIPKFSRLSAASLFGYVVWPLSRNGVSGQNWSRNKEIQKKKKYLSVKPS